MRWSVGLLLISAVSCVRLSPYPPPTVAWHRLYQPLEDPDAVLWVAAAYEQVIAEWGTPAHVWSDWMLLRSEKRSDVVYQVKEGFSLTEIIDDKNHRAAIYVGEESSHPAYPLLLAHEAAHLFNPYITDWYMEGAATLFAIEFCASRGVSTAVWEEAFKKNKNDPYANAYQLMRELKSAFPDTYAQLIHTTERIHKQACWQRIDIDRWLDQRSESDRARALTIIHAYADQLQKQSDSAVVFTTPQSLNEMR